MQVVLSLSRQPDVFMWPMHSTWLRAPLWAGTVLCRRLSLLVCSGRRWRRLGLLTVLVGLGVSCARGQEVGRVEDIREQQGEASIDSTEAAILIRGIEESDLLRRNAPLYTQNLLRIYRSGLFVDVRFNRPNLDTRVFFGTRRTLDAAGTYEVRDTTIVGLSRLKLVIKQGILVIEHRLGQLETVAAGIRTWIGGTTVLFRVDENEDEGLVFLEEGEILFPEYGFGGTVADDQPERAWRLQRGQAPVELVLTAAQLEQWRQEVDYNTRTIWQGGPKPFWKRPGFYVPAGVAVAALSGVVLYRALRPDDDGSSRGRVIIRIPP